MKFGQQRRTVEDAVRFVQKKYQNRPSPLALMNENVGFAPPQVPEYMRAKNDLRGSLLGNFRPPNDTFR